MASWPSPSIGAGVSGLLLAVAGLLGYAWKQPSVPWGRPSSPIPATLKVPPLQQPQVDSGPLSVGDPLSFADVPPDYWARPMLDALSARGLIAGLPDGRFLPEHPVTRAELAAQLSQTFHLPERRPPPLWSDVAADHWAVLAIHRSAAMGFLAGYPEGHFAPEEQVSRAEMVVAIANGLQLSPASAPATDLTQFSDHHQLLPHQRPPLQAALSAGLIVAYPYPTKLRPHSLATRAEVAATLHSALAYLGHLPSIPSPYRVP